MPARYALGLLLALLLAPLTVRAQAGTLDATFGTDGIALGELLSSTSASVAVDEHKHTVVSGTAVIPNGKTAPFLARYTPEGTLDPFFADDGVLFTYDPTEMGRGGPVVVLPDGSYLQTMMYGSWPAIRVRRVSTAGAVLCTAMIGYGEVGGAAVTGSGDVVLAVRGPMADVAGLVVVRVDVNYSTGTCGLDTSFGNGGYAAVQIPGLLASATDVAVQSDGRIVVSGWVQSDPGPVKDASPVAARLKGDGGADPTFGYNGDGFIVCKPEGVKNAVTTDVAIGPDGAIVLGGYAEKDDEKPMWLAIRLRFDGIPDDTFGADGSVLIQPAPETHSQVMDVVVDDKGRPVLVGTVDDAWGLARLRASDGALDHTFGDGGITITRPFGMPGALAAVALQPDGEIVVGGDVKKDEGQFYAVARYDSGDEATAAETGPEVGAVLRVWPNPVAGAATLDLTLDTAGEVHAALYDVMGRQVADLGRGVRPSGAARLALDLAGVAPGVYVVRVETPDGVQAQRLTVR
ncbi:MAG TPA: T9SS type A sorting domain-containing protein [Rhodothermales bacterium]|nr:T9SS type A sorting domain-containing protein [Rhodothermales bacterium]